MERSEFVYNVIDRAETLSTIKDIINGVHDTYMNYILPDDFITESTTLDDLGMDSLDEVEIILTIENRFNISVPEDWTMDTVGDAVNLVMSLKNNK